MLRKSEKRAEVSSPIVRSVTHSTGLSRERSGRSLARTRKAGKTCAATHFACFGAGGHRVAIREHHAAHQIP